MAKHKLILEIDDSFTRPMSLGQNLENRLKGVKMLKVSKIRGPLKKWEITYKGDSISYTYRSKAVAKVGLGNITAERWNHDPNDYQIRIKP